MRFKDRALTIGLEVLDTGLNIIITLAIVFFIRSFIFSPFLISGTSMASTLSDREYILVNKFGYSSVLGYEVGEPQRGDIIVLKAPLVSTDETIYYIKRVVGLPGETILLSGSNVIIKNTDNPEGFELKEDYIKCVRDNTKCSNYNRSNSNEIISYTIPMESYFVMGDNRDHSTDSRLCFASCTLEGSTHFLKRENIIGKSSVVLWPFKQARFID